MIPERVKATTLLVKHSQLSTSRPVVTLCEGGGLLERLLSALAQNGNYFRNTVSCHKMNMVIHENAFYRCIFDVPKFKRLFFRQFYKFKMAATKFTCLAKHVLL